MKKHKPKIADKKLRGEWAEMCFMVRAAEYGLQVNKPWGEMSRYDFVVGHKLHFVCVQVKSTTEKLGEGYGCTVRGGHRPYVGKVFNFLAAYVVLEDVWYIIPAEEIRGRGYIPLYPTTRRGEFEKYREAWHLLQAPESTEGTVDCIQACVEEFVPTWLRPCATAECLP